MAQKNVVAEMSGTVIEINCLAGATVAEGDALLVLESMKMEVPLMATQGGKVVDVQVAVGDSVADGQVLVVIDIGQ